MPKAKPKAITICPVPGCWETRLCDSAYCAEHTDPCDVELGKRTTDPCDDPDERNLRLERFACAALTGILSSEPEVYQHDIVADDAFGFAEAMEAEFQKRRAR